MRQRCRLRRQVSTILCQPPHQELRSTGLGGLGRRHSLPQPPFYCLHHLYQTGTAEGMEVYLCTPAHLITDLPGECCWLLSPGSSIATKQRHLLSLSPTGSSPAMGHSPTAVCSRKPRQAGASFQSLSCSLLPLQLLSPSFACLPSHSFPVRQPWRLHKQRKGA